MFEVGDTIEYLDRLVVIQAKTETGYLVSDQWGNVFTFNYITLEG